MKKKNTDLSSHLDMSKLKGAKIQDFHGPILRKIYRVASIYVAEKAAKHTKITPNQITLFSFLLFLLAAYFLYAGKYPYLIFSSIFIEIGFFFDYIDGSLARIKGTANTFGRWLDMFAGQFILVALFYSAMNGVFRNTGNYLVWVYGTLGLIALFLLSLLYNFFLRLHENGLEEIEKEKKKHSFLVNFYYTEYLIFHLLALAGILNMVNEFLIFCAVYGWIFLMVIFSKLSMKAYRLKRIWNEI